jgi:hypothetical protein
MRNRYREIALHIIKQIRSGVRCNCTYCMAPETEEMIEQFRADHDNGLLV